MKTRKGFTIVELVVVIAVIAILAAVLIPSFSGIVEKTEKSTALKLAEAAYKEARAAANEDGSITEGEVFGANGFNFRFDAGGATAKVVAYPDGYKYIILISADTLSIFGERGVDLIPPVQDVPDTMSIDLYRKNITLSSGQSEMLFAAVTPAYATGYTVEWSVPDDDDAQYISVENGRITAESVTPGDHTAKVTATLKVNGEEKASVDCQITVVPVGVSNITLNKINTSLGLNESETLSADIKPADAEPSVIEWSSSDESVVTVDNNGEIKAKKFGNAVVTAKVGDKTASCGVTVCGIKLISNPTSMQIGQKHVMDFEIFPVGAEVTWESSKPSAVSIDENGVVTALQETSQPVTITATANGYSEEHEITVVMQPEEQVLGIEFTSDDPTPIINATLRQDGVIKLAPSNLPANLPIDWVVTSGDEEAVAIEGNVVKPVKAGVATLTATIKFGEQLEYTAACKIEVLPYLVTVNAAHATVMREGNDGEYNITVNNGYELNRGETFNVRVLPEEGYVITGFTVSGSTIDENTVQFDGGVMQINNVTGDITITVETTSKVEETSLDGIEKPSANDEQTNKMMGFYAKGDKNILYIYSPSKLMDGATVYLYTDAQNKAEESYTLSTDTKLLTVPFGENTYACVEIKFNSLGDMNEAELIVTYDAAPLYPEA